MSLQCRMMLTMRRGQNMLGTNTIEPPNINLQSFVDEARARSTLMKLVTLMVQELFCDISLNRDRCPKPDPKILQKSQN